MNNRVRLQDDPLNWVALGAVLFGFACIAAFFWLRAITPSDGARMVPTQNVWFGDGVVLTPWQPQSADGLQPGDKVISVNGILMLNLAQAAVQGRGNIVADDYDMGAQVVYQVVRDGRIRDVSVTLHPFPFGAWFEQNWLMIAACTACLIIAAIVFFKRPSDRTTRAMLLWVPGIWAASVMYSLGVQVGDIVFGSNVWLFLFTALAGYVLTLVAVVRFAFEFTRPPEAIAGILRSGKTIILTYVLPYLFIVVFLVVQWLLDPNALRWFGRWRVGTAIVAACSIIIALLTSVWSYVTTHDYLTRQRIRWIVYAGGIVAVANLLLNVLPAALLRAPLIDLTVNSLLFLMFQSAIAYAILRYRYLEVDLIINRTLVFGVISAAFALLYFGGLVLIQAVVGSGSSITNEQNDVLIVITTLIGIALFNPMRQAAQKLVDRIFYRHKYEAAKRIAWFSAALRDDEYADMDKLTKDLLSLTNDIVKPAHTSLWLRNVTHKPVEAE